MQRTVRREELSEAKRRLLEQRIRGVASAKQADRIQPRAPGVPVPISAEQYRVWLHAAQVLDLPLYNEAITIHKRGRFDLKTFEAAFNEILRRHEAWSTSFAVVNGEVLQIMNPELRVELPLTDLAHLPAKEREAEALRLATADTAVPIPLDTAPLFRVRVVRMAPGEHRLYLTLHHIIFDGVSIYRILMPELAAIYTALESGATPALPVPELQYGDYALWRKEHLNSPAVEQHLAYWQKHLAGDLPVLRLPVDRPRPVHISHRGSMECFQVPGGLLQALRELSRVHGVTLYMTLLAAFKVLLFRYSGQEDLIVGGATDARRRPELEHLMGYFLDTFAMRTRPSAGKRFSEYLHEVRDSVVGALGAADVPFDRVVQAVRPVRDSSHHPIFQAFFSIEPPVVPFAEGWDLTQMDVTVGTAKFDVYLELDERPDHMAARFMYNTDIFDAPTIRRMAGHWLVLLDAVVRTPDATLGSLPLLTEDELAGLAVWNDTAREDPQTTLHRLIEEQAERKPDAVAVIAGGAVLTYAGLNARANVLARALQKAGAAPGSLVAVLLERSKDLLAGILGVLKTGAAYLPLDPDNPQARTALCLDDAKPAAVLTQQSLQAQLGSYTGHIVLVDQAREQTQPSSYEGTPEDTAYVIHTSGSTGQPKGVVIAHRSVVNLLASVQATPGFSAEDVLLAVTTISFDIAALELFLPLFSGGRVVIASREEAHDPYFLGALIESSGCTVMQATPSTWRALLASGWKGPSRRLRVLCGGEALPRELAERLLATGVELWNMYGPTETTIWSTVHSVSSGSGPVPIGRPIANTTAYVLDGRGQLLPANIPGELYLGGVGLAKGYRGLPALTAERFVNVEAAGGERLYRTGDLALRRADGTLECMGRVDNQVKVRGFRVELEAVEAAVQRHPQVLAAAARVWPEADGAMRLSVYVTGREGAPPDAKALRQFLQGYVPEYMVPSDVIALPTIPLTPNGKTDRNALPPPTANTVQRNSPETERPSTEQEKRVAALWRDLLNVPSVAADDDFFDLGGHSLLIAALQRRIELEFDTRVPMAALFHGPTVRQQAALLEAQAGTGPTQFPAGLLPLQPKGKRSALFWIHPQRPVGNLTDALGEDQPVYGVVLTQADMDELGPTPAFESIAARHVRTILDAQPQGPYYLGGLCTGGILAYETAAQLQAAGHEVALVVLLDSQNPFFYKRVGSLAVETSKALFHLRKLYRYGRSGPVPLHKRLVTRIKRIWEENAANTEMGIVEQTTDSAAYKYHPPRYDGRILLLQPMDRPARVDFLPGWRVVASQLMPRDVQGHHDELLTPENVGSVAEAITSAMDQIRDRRLRSVPPSYAEVATHRG